MGSSLTGMFSWRSLSTPSFLLTLWSANSILAGCIILVPAQIACPLPAQASLRSHKISHVSKEAGLAENPSTASNEILSTCLSTASGEGFVHSVASLSLSPLVPSAEPIIEVTSRFQFFLSTLKLVKMIVSIPLKPR